MFDQKKILAVCPARGGSKGLPGKNIMPLAGIPLTGLVGMLCSSIPEIDRAIVSTDDDKIASVSEQYNLPAPFRRPEEISGDRIGDYDVLIHALQTMEQTDGVQYDIVLMLQPTSPIRTRKQILQAIELLSKEGLDSVWSVSPIDLKYHPKKQLKIENGRLQYNDPEGSKIIARQQLDERYIRNGVVYAMTRDCLVEQKSIKGKKTGALVIENPVANIDTLDDFKRAEEILEKGIVKIELS